MENGLSNRHHFRQSPTLISGKYSLSRTETDLVFSLLTEITLEDKDFRDYTITSKQLSVKLGREVVPSRLKATVESLMGKVLKIETNEDKWEILSWFSYFGYDKGVITYRFDKRMKPYLLQLKQWVSADIRHLVQMKSEYSKRIYLLLKEHQKFGERKFNISELMENLEVPKSFRTYSNFKIKVLSQAVTDINKFTDIEIKNIGTVEKPIYFDEFKPSRSVQAVTFHFKKNLIDLNSFIQWIRELYTGVPLFKNKEGRILMCSQKGHLYYSDGDMETLTKEKALIAWAWLHTNREKLVCFKEVVETEEEIRKKIEDMIDTPPHK
ncbi:MAG: replication initiation protein [Sulfurovum sp.]|nr:replication initiation protein [Sulfurovum sp.]